MPTIVPSKKAMPVAKGKGKNINKDTEIDTQPSNLVKQTTRFKERTRVEYPEEGRKAVSRLIEEEIMKCGHQKYREGKRLVAESERIKKSNPKKSQELKEQGQELIDQSLNFSPAAFQRHMEEFVFPDGQRYPITHNQFYLLLRASEQGYSMAILIRLAFHLTKDADRTISYSYEELVAIASCNASRQYFDYSKGSLVVPDEIENDNEPSETLNGH